MISILSHKHSNSQHNNRYTFSNIMMPCLRLQDEKNQILIASIWLNLVSNNLYHFRCNCHFIIIIIKQFGQSQTQMPLGQHNRHNHNYSSLADRKDLKEGMEAGGERSTVHRKYLFYAQWERRGGRERIGRERKEGRCTVQGAGILNPPIAKS